MPVAMHIGTIAALCAGLRLSPRAGVASTPPTSEVIASLLATWTAVGRGLRAGLPTVATAPSAVANCPRSS